MAVWLLGKLEPEPYWTAVCGLANDLLAASDLREWTVFVRAKKPEDVAGAQFDSFDGAEQPWPAQIDRVRRELTIAVPPETPEPDEGEPEDAASYIVLDILDELVAGDRGTPRVH